MAVTVRQFKNEFPEFAETDERVVQSRIDMATRDVSARVFGDRTDDAIKWRTAMKLAKGPLGEQARLRAENRATVYDSEYESIKRSVVSGFRVI